MDKLICAFQSIHSIYLDPLSACERKKEILWMCVCVNVELTGYNAATSDLPSALMTGTDRTLHVAVTCAPHFCVSCVRTHPTGEHPSCTRIRFPMQFVSSNWAAFNAVSAAQPLYGRLAAPSKPMINGLREIRDSLATTNCDAKPAAYHGAASHTSSPISKPLLALRPTPSTTPAQARPSTIGNSWWSYVL